jgi:hypothetical protein
MFTTLAFGLCALVIESAGQISNGAFEYPAVGVGTIDGDKCRVTLFLAVDRPTPSLLMNGSYHSFRVEKISEKAAILWIDGANGFVVARANVL